MAIDPIMVIDATEQAEIAVKGLRSLAVDFTAKLAGDVEIHAETKASLAAKFPDRKTAWETARDAMDAALMP